MDKNQPNVFLTDQASKPGKKWFQTWKIVYPILGVVVVSEIIWGIATLLAPIPKKALSQEQKLLPNPGAKISLVSNKLSYKISDKIPVIVKLSTGGYLTSGTDLILRYDPKVLEASQLIFSKGKIYDDFPVIDVDRKEGIIKVSAITSIGKGGFNGTGDLGTINFTAKVAGITNIAIDFKKGQTDDSNIIRSSNSQDVLESVSHLKLTIQ